MIKRRNMWIQVALVIVTLGLYGIYWYYVSTKEMGEYLHMTNNPVLWTILSLIPLVNLYAYWKHSVLVEAITTQKYPPSLIFVLWVFFNPAVWYITQSTLNNLAPITED
ncbi:MAG: DUF4234 domain-containing protein [Lysobacterales bacterium]